MSDDNRRQLADVLARLGQLLENGVKLLPALEAVQAGVSDSVLSALLSRMKRFVERGHALSESIEDVSIFTSDSVRIIETGEVQGQLDTALLKLAVAVNQGTIPVGPMPSPEELERTDDEESADIDAFVSQTLRRAFQAGASDLHIDPTPEGATIRWRVDGVLHTQPDVVSSSLYCEFLGRIKMMAGLDPAEKRLPQDGRIFMDIADLVNADGPTVDLRLSICPYINGEKTVIRFLDTSKFPDTIDEIMPSAKADIVRRWLCHGYGLVLVTGPTGSGKTTTLLLIVNELAKTGRSNIITLEDPVEMVMAGVNQMPINPAIGLTFDAGLRAIIRQDPDVIMVGEIRQPETAILVAQAAQTGHILLTQLHAPDAVGALFLMAELGVKVHILRELVRGVIAQRLVRRLCCECKRPLSEDEKRDLPEAYRLLKGPLYEPVGCKHCSDTGYRGRIAIYEMLEPKEALWTTLKSGVPIETLRNSRLDHHTTLREEGLRTVSDGVTSYREIERVVSSP